MEKTYSHKRTAFALPKIFVPAYIVIIIISILYIFLFVHTGTSKLLNVDGFKGAMDKAKIFGRFTGILSYAVPIIELVIGLLLAISIFRIKRNNLQPAKASLYASAILMALFTAYLGYILLFAENIPCTCGGIIQDMTWQQHLIFNSVFLLLAIWCIYFVRRNKRMMET